MAASAKRKQEEKHLKLLREMSSLPPNRKCFDCDQRGPTYTDMTVGSFVCTSCSGILRGLNPPHRVKSISMTTFTQQEIEFLQKHGNEVCKQIWLGLFDDRSSAIPDFRDPQKVKEFLQEKYEKKRWYVPPEQAKVVASVHASISGSSASSTSSTPEVKPLKSLLGEAAPALHLNKGTPSQSPVVGRSQGQQQQEKKQFDLLSDLGSDIFAAPAPQSTATANFANFAHFNSHTAQNSANAGFANFDAFGQSSGSSNFGGFPTASQSSFQPQNTAFRTLSSSCSFGEFTSAFPLQAVHSGSAGSVNANFAHFDNFPKSSSADFGAFNASQSNATVTGASKAAVNKPGLQSADKYAALANLDNIFSAGQGGSEQGSGFSTVVSASAGPALSAPNQSSASSDKYAALAELDSVFSSTATSSNAYTSTSNVSSNAFGTVPVAATSQTQPASSSVPASFGATPSTNPFVAAPVAPVAPSTNPFQTNSRGATGLSGAMHSHIFPHAHFATFGTASMSMPAGFGTPASYSLPTSFSGNFQQPTFPTQAAFPQQTAFAQQPNGAGFAAFGQAKPVVTPFGQVAAVGVSSNPFMAGAPTGQFPAGNSSTNPFL
ncbi:arf-GAP domain and FG repeat-containing protein 1 isoform X2 [Gallus gallus]|uniref:arf-GAP domain and FG repeat-containing protein 1 isoform X2 n=1 Tax=Gallus gallus TaxID=9031 RepID=UPI000739E52A|nr:arf-GAP domain and FG repeat-containing protein 1 isoform X2 [Gallus gallus]XP_040535230.1 arf-GAP domain and FG repeat-containing protein 1 isoform X2 [Gallus gallus]|eukprot:XP_015132464.1 arf-GAP domain and FG repeat-containing protein 1 isoform X2 [Gallus gallus]